MKGVWHLIGDDLADAKMLAKLGHPWSPVEWALFDRWRSVWGALA